MSGSDQRVPRVTAHVADFTGAVLVVDGDHSLPEDRTRPTPGATS